jgi:hypothetical protein
MDDINDDAEKPRIADYHSTMDDHHNETNDFLPTKRHYKCGDDYFRRFY